MWIYRRGQPRRRETSQTLMQGTREQRDQDISVDGNLDRRNINHMMWKCADLLDFQRLSLMWLNHFSYVHFSEVGKNMYMGNFNPNMNPIMLDSNQVRRGCHSHYKQQRSSPVFA